MPRSPRAMRRAGRSAPADAPGALPQRVGRALLLVWVLLLPLLGGRLEIWWSIGLHALSGAAFLLALLVFARRREIIWFRGTALMPLLLFVAWSALSAWQGVQPRAGLLELERLLFGALWLVSLLWLGEPGDGPRLLLLLGVSGLVAALRGWWEYGATLVTFGDPSWRIFAGFFTPTVTASYLALTLFPLLACALRPPGDRAWLRPLLGFGVALVLGALLLTGARGGLLAALGGGVVWLGLALRALLAGGQADGGGRSRRVLLAVAVAVVLLLVALPVSPVGRRLLARGGLDHSMMFRALTWRGTAAMAAERPLAGFGPGSFIIVHPRFSEVGFTRMAHNTPLQIAGEQGVPGLLLWLWWWLGVLWLVLHLPGRDASAPERAWRGALAASWTAFLLHQLVDYGWYFPAVSGASFVLAGAAALLARGASATVVEMPRRHAWSPIASLLVGIGTLALLADSYRAAMGALAVDEARRLGQEAAVRQGLQRLQDAAHWDPLNPDAPRLQASWRASRGRFLGDLQQLRLAEEQWAVAQRLDPENARVYQAGANVANAAGRPELAFDRAREAVRRAPLDTRLWMELAETALELGRRQVAVECWRRVLQIARGPVAQYNPLPEYVFDPNFGEAALQLGGELERDGRPAEAGRHYALAVDYLTKALERQRQSQSIMEAAGQSVASELRRLEDLLGEARTGAARLAPGGG